MAPMIKLEPIKTNFERKFDELEKEPDEESPTWSLGDILQSLEETDKTPEFMVTKANDLVQLLQRYPMLKKELVLNVFGRRLQRLLFHPAKEVVAAGYRTARYAIANLESLKAIIALRTDSLIIKSLAKGAKFNIEREQAIKFIRHYLEIPGALSELSLGVVCALTAVAESREDRLQSVALETLTELFIFDPQKVSQAGGVRVLSQTLINGPYELTDSIALGFIYLLDKPGSRSYVWPGQDLDVVLSAFTELQEQDRVNELKLKSCARVLSLLLKTWQGLFYMCMYDFRGVKSLIRCLKIPLPQLRDIIMDLLFDIFNIKAPPWSGPFLAGRRMSKFIVPQNRSSVDDIEQLYQTYALNEHYTSIILALFIDIDLLTFLVNVIEENTDLVNSRKATLLLGEIIGLASKILPHQYSKKTQVLGPLFSSAAQFNTLDRFTASSAIYQIDRITKNLYRSFPEMTALRRDPGETSKDSKRSDLKKMKLSLHLDDTYFRSLLLETNVLSTKNFTKWNWDTLIELMQGPLLNPKRLDEAVRATKFMKRLMSFYRPFKYRFSEIRKTSGSNKYVDAGCILFKTLLANPEGVKYLMENKLLRQIAECLAQLDPASGITSAEPLFSKHRLETTLSYGYFTLLGTLSSDPNGVAMIERWRMFNMFYHLSELPDRKDLIIAFISSFDYKLEGHTRILLSKVLVMGEKDVRMFATSHLGRLIDHENTNMRNWAVDLLIEGMYDPDKELRELAVRILGTACEHPRTLNYIVDRLPPVDQLPEASAPLMLSFLSTSEGFRYLKEPNYIETEMKNWFDKGNAAYVSLVEHELVHYLMKTGDGNSKLKGRRLHVPPNFYRSLVQTPEGCALLKQSNDLEQFILYVKENYGKAAHDDEVLWKIKAYLWAIGNIGSQSLGATFLESTDIVKVIVDIANNSPVWSLKGTAFYVLGLIASTSEGLEIIDEHDWYTTVSVMGEPLGLCVPVDLTKFLLISEWECNNILRPSRRGVYVMNGQPRLKQILVSNLEDKSSNK
ncbi:Rapamycin-insensitive companion of mTOR, N-term-domain-containing protein [Dipodascopsis uninucleata]